MNILLLSNTQLALGVELEDSKRDILHFYNGQYIETGADYGEIDITLIEITEQEVKMTFREDYVEMTNHEYEVLIFWDSYATRYADLTINHTKCFVNQYSAETETILFNSSGIEIFRDEDVSFSSAGLTLTWEFNSTFVQNPSTPTAIYAMSRLYSYQYEITATNLEEWFDFYPNDSHTFSIEALDWNFTYGIIVFIGAITILKIRKKKSD
ncbi:MAG: hypothetical protein FK734_03355 [Asgard group archaeon]|nr:hypothetical protein [Asgard group archaeon]